MNHSNLPDPQLSIGQLDFDFIRALVRRKSSITLDQSKAYLVVSRLSPIAREHGFDSVGTLISHLQSRAGEELHDPVVEAIATTETSFFRDLHPFTALRDKIIPELVRLRQNTNRSLSIWSAACSSGQEPHSMAMLLRERFADLAGWNLHLVASDISEKMVQRAQEGIYSQLEINRGLPAPYLIRFFDQHGDQWRLKPEVRQMFRFFQQNLADEWTTLAPVDLLVLRNVLIYFDVETRRTMLRKVRKLLKPDGYLLLGSAETTLHLDENFTRVRIGRTVFYQVSKGATR